MPAAIGPGTTIERYRVEKVIGAGSMGDVFLGIDIDLKRKVALKILNDRHRDNKELRARFVREARAVAKISHPNVVQVFTTGSFDDRPYLAMEFLDGTDLGSSVKEQGPWPSLRAAKAILDGSRGLDAAAKAGLIHRDVKPSNLVLLQTGIVKVTDFGLAKPIEATDEPALTALGVVVGTPDYIAPEQARGDSIDHRVDIYALGGTLYFLLTGVPPFRTGRPADDKYLKVVARHLKKPAPDACVRNRHADRELAQLVQYMMAKRADERPSYAQLAERLSSIIERLERGGSPPTPAEALQSSGEGGRTSPTPFVGGPAPTAYGGSGDSVDEGAPTRVRMPSTGVEGLPQAGGSVVKRPGLPGWLLGVSAASVLVFAVGLGLKLCGPMPDPPEEPPPPADAAVAAENVSIDAAPPALPTPPEGMLLVTRDDGSPWFFVDAEPVDHSDYAAIFPKQKKRRKSKRAVTGVAYKYAQAYADAKQKRLLSAEEWQAAARTAGFVAAGKQLWEWIGEAPDAAGQSKKPVISAEGGAMRKSRGGKDITFRLGSDLQ